VPWIQRAFVVDDWYIPAYEPILDIQEKIVGMLYVGMMESEAPRASGRAFGPVIPGQGFDAWSLDYCGMHHDKN